MAGKPARHINDPMRELVIRAIKRKLERLPPEVIAAELVEEARRRGSLWCRVELRARGLAVLFPHGDRIEWDGAVWAFLPRTRP